MTYKFQTLSVMDDVKKDDRILAIAKRIKDLRIENGYTSYEKFAIKHDFQGKQYWRLEEGHDFKVSTLLRIVDAHNLSLEDFFKGVK